MVILGLSVSYYSCSGNAVDIFAVSRSIKCTIYREKTEIINPWGPQPPPKWCPWRLPCLGIDIKSLDAFHMKCQRRILGISWHQFVWNEEIVTRTEQQFEQWMSDDQISSFADFCDKPESFVSNVDSQRVLICSCGFVNICIVDMSNVPQFVLVVKVRESMVVEVYRGNSLSLIHIWRCRRRG